MNQLKHRQHILSGGRYLQQTKMYVSLSSCLFSIFYLLLSNSDALYLNMKRDYSIGGGRSKYKASKSPLPTSSSATVGPMKSIRYEMVVWDCDGVLVDSEALLKQGEVEALQREGFADITIEDCVRMFSGVSPDKATQNFLSEKGKPLPPNFFKEQIEGSMQLFRDRLEPLMEDTVKRLSTQGIKMCVASGSPRARVLLCLEKGGIDACFAPESVFNREEVKLGKPAPDLFLHAANKMGISPEKCVVVEDAVSGIQAALAANMKCIAYLGGGHTKPEWYQKSIRDFGIPIAYTQEQVYEKIAEYFPDLQKDIGSTTTSSKAIPPGNIASTHGRKNDKDHAGSIKDYPGMNRPFSIKF